MFRAVRKRSSVAWATLALGGVAAIVALGAWLLVVSDWADRPGPLVEHTVVVVEPGSAFAGVARELQREGVIDDAGRLRMLARWRSATGAIHAGEYRFGPHEAPSEVLHRLVSGDIVVHRLRILEGWTVRELLDAMATARSLDRVLDGAGPMDLLPALGLGDAHAEGRFFPDTYHYVRGDSDADLLARAYRSMAEVLAGEWAARDLDLPYADADEALIMASLIEKETGLAEHRARIGGVLVRRLQRGMRLQTDPSVIYGAGGGVRRQPDAGAPHPERSLQHVHPPGVAAHAHRVARPRGDPRGPAPRARHGDVLRGAGGRDDLVFRHAARAQRSRTTLPVGNETMKRGRFITLEGVDGAGKSTSVEAVQRVLRERGMDLLVTREPGGTPLAERVREVLLHVGDEAVDPLAETLLLFAARAQHVSTVIGPALAQGRWGVERPLHRRDARLPGAAARGIDPHPIESLACMVHPGLEPDLTFYLDLPVDQARQRIGSHAPDAGLDRFEREQRSFHQRVRARYRELARTEERVRTIDASRSPREVAAAITRHLTAFVDAAR